MEPIYYSSAIVHYDLLHKKIVAKVDKQLILYYLRLIPRYLWVNSQRYSPHITVVRSPPKEIVEDFHNINKWDGRNISFFYNGIIHFSHPYFYLEIESREISIIREELGLPRFRAGFSCYHLTIGNIKC